MRDLVASPSVPLSSRTIALGERLVPWMAVGGLLLLLLLNKGTSWLPPVVRYKIELRRSSGKKDYPDISAPVLAIHVKLPLRVRCGSLPTT